MAKKSKRTATKIDEELIKKVDSIVDEIEKTNNFKKINLDEIEEVGATSSIDKVQNSATSNSNDDIEQLEFTDSYSASEILSDNADLNKTNEYEFKFDKSRLEEVDSLDTSFLEGRIKNAKTIKKNINASIKHKLDLSRFNFSFPYKFLLNRYVGFGILTFLSLIVLVIVVVKIPQVYKRDGLKPDLVKNNIQNTIPSIDDNYLFIGDVYTDRYDVSKFLYGMHVVKVSSDDMTSGKLLSSMRENIYIYNPSKVFLSLGNIELNDDNDISVFVDNLKKIALYIEENRPSAILYIESVYPVCDDTSKDNEYIIKANAEIEKFCEKNDIVFIDIFRILYDKNEENLNRNYVSDGCIISEEGYKKITDIIKKYLKA